VKPNWQDSVRERKLTFYSGFYRGIHEKDDTKVLLGCNWFYFGRDGLRCFNALFR
jgi:hypothetical protein